MDRSQHYQMEEFIRKSVDHHHKKIQLPWKMRNHPMNERWNFFTSKLTENFIEFLRGDFF